jgi:glutamine synthetase
MAGIARGKILPAQKFLAGMRSHGLRIPEDVFVQTVNGDYPEDTDGVTSASTRDVYMIPDESTIRLVPWYDEPTAQVICDAFHFEEGEVQIAARHILKRILALYEAEGWRPVVAPELEFFLVDVNTDPDYPLEPPIGRSGRRETGRQAYGIDAVNEFDPIFEDIYDFCEAQGIDIDTLIHEGGAAQMEINFNHGDPLLLADQAFLFKRTVREAAMRHGRSTPPSWPSRCRASPAAPCTSTRACSTPSPGATCSPPARQGHHPVPQPHRRPAALPAGRCRCSRPT